jgi:uncharacterized protein (TIGR00251 family)
MTAALMEWLQETDEGFVVTVAVQPRSAKNAVVGIHAGAVKIKLTAPPVEGAANKALVKYLAKHTGTPASSVELLSGHLGRRKRILFRLPPDPNGRLDWKNRIYPLFKVASLDRQVGVR